MITLNEAKNYLRIDYEEDDKLILQLLDTAKSLVKDVGRMDEERFSENEDVVRTAMLYTVSYLYENRNTADFSKLTLTLRAMLLGKSNLEIFRRKYGSWCDQRNAEAGVSHSAKSKLDAVCNRQSHPVSGEHL